MGRSKGRGTPTKNQKTPEWENPLGQGKNENSMMAASVYHSGFSSHPGVILQPVAGSSSALNEVSSLGDNSEFVPLSHELAQSATSASSQLAPNMPLHQLLSLMSSHPALQNSEAQAYATNLVIQNHSSLLTSTPQHQDVTPHDSSPGPRFPVPVTSVASTTTLSASPQLQVTQYAARPVRNSPAQATTISSSYSLNRASSPLDLTTTNQTGNAKERSNTNSNSPGENYHAVGSAGRVELFNARHLVNNIRTANTPPVISVGLPGKMSLSPNKLVPKNVTFHLLPSNVEKPFPLSDVMLYKKDGFGAKVLQIGRMDTSGRVGVIIDQTFPILVGHLFNIVTERSHQAGPRQFVFQKEGAPTGMEVFTPPLRNLILYIQPHLTLSTSVVRTVTNAPVPEVVWRYISGAPKSTQIEGASHGLTSSPSVQPAMPSHSGVIAGTESSSTFQDALDYSILGGQAMETSLMTRSSNTGFHFNPELNTPNLENSVSRVLGMPEYHGSSNSQQAVSTPEKKLAILQNNGENSLEVPTYSELTSSPPMAVAEQSTQPSEASATSSNIMANFGSRALAVVANASRITNDFQLPEATDTNAATLSQENVRGTLQGTSSTPAISPSVFRLNSRLTPPYHDGVAYQRPSVLQYPGFHPSNRQNGAVARVRTSSSVAPTFIPQAESGSGSVARRRALNLRLGRGVFFDLVDDTLDGYALDTPQGYYLQVADRDAGRRHVRVKRRSFEDTFLRYYINLGRQNVNLRRLLRVAYIGDDGEDEPAADAGGPRGEYIGMLREQLRSGFWEGFPLFDYGENGKLPTTCALLGDNGTFFAVGLAFADLIFNSGTSIDGLSPHLIALLKKMNSGIHPFVENVVVSDVLDEDVVEVFEILTAISKGGHNVNVFLDQLKSLVMEWNVTIPDSLTYRTALSNRNSVVQSYFVKSRFSALWDFYEGLKAGGVMEYLDIYPEKWESLFPRKGDLIVTAEEIMHNIEFRDSDGILLSDDDGHVLENFEIVVRQYITEIAGDSAKVRHFLMCVTGFDVITPGKIFVEPQPDPTNEQIKFSACGKKIIVPVACNLQYFTEAVGLDLDFNRS